MSSARAQAMIDAPPETVWELVGDPNRHPEWWPRVVEVECEGLEEGCDYRRVLKRPGGTEDTTILVERLDDCRELLIRCLDTGSYNKFTMTEARGGTFVDAEFGMDPTKFGKRVIDTLAGKRYFRKWLQQSLDALREAAAKPRSGA